MDEHVGEPGILGHRLQGAVERPLIPGTLREHDVPGQAGEPGGGADQVDGCPRAVPAQQVGGDTGTGAGSPLTVTSPTAFAWMK